jgi:uncharacterized protein with beta-barrel porin domain
VVAPRDAQIYSAESFAFAQAAQNAVTAILGRTLPEGGGDTFYNVGGGSDGPAMRGWMEGVGWQIDPAGFRATSGGLEGGLDHEFGPGLRLGVAAGYQQSSLTDGMGGAANQDETFVGLYGSRTVGDVGVSAALAYAYSNDASNRASGFGFSHANSALSAVLGAVQVAAPFSAGVVIVTPAAGIYISDVSSDGFQERNARNGAFAVAGSSSNGTGVSPYVTVGLSHDFITSSGVIVTPDVAGGYQYDAVASGLPISLVAQDGTAFAGNAIGLDRNSGLFGGSLTAHKDHWTGFVRYDAEVGTGWYDQTLSGGFKFAF